jgi:hypothetical protein
MLKPALKDGSKVALPESMWKNKQEVGELGMADVKK